MQRAYEFTRSLCCVHAKEVRFSGKGCYVSGWGDLVVRHSGRLVRREAKGGPCTTRDKKRKVVRLRRRVC